MELQLFAFKSSLEFGVKVSEHLRIPLSSMEERDFEDGEHKTRPLENVRGRDVFVIQSLFADERESVNDKICRLLFFIGALKDSSAGKITVVLPYFAYARKDRKTKDRDPVTMKYMALLMEAVGANHVITMDVHNISAYQNAFRIPTDLLEARLLFAPYFFQLACEEEIVVVSPDSGGVKRANSFHETLSELTHKTPGKAFLEKHRSEGQVSGGEAVIGDVKGKVAIIIDDIISSGKTIRLAVEALDRAGAKRIFACATHGLFVGNANKELSHPKLERVLITDSIKPFRLEKIILDQKITILDSSVLFAKAMKRIQAGDSLVDLTQHFPHALQELNSLS